jgi:hypothetical protein
MFSCSKYFDELLQVAASMATPEVAATVKLLERSGLRLEASMVVMDHLNVDRHVRDIAFADATLTTFLKTHK